MKSLVPITLFFLVFSGCGDDDAAGLEGTDPAQCADGVDNDGDGAIDCADSGCRVLSVCGSADGGRDASNTIDSSAPDAAKQDASADAANTMDASTQDASGDSSTSDASVGDATVDATADATVDAATGYYKGAPNQCEGLNFDQDTATNAATDSAVGCFASAAGNSETFRNCIRDAVKATDEDITDGCGYCYGVIGNCITDFCLGQCIADPNSAACLGCQCDAGCFDAFDTCSSFDASAVACAP